MNATKSSFLQSKEADCLEFEGYKEEIFSNEEINNHYKDKRDIEEASRGQY